MAKNRSGLKVGVLLLVLLLVLGLLGTFAVLAGQRLVSAQQANTCTVTGQDGATQTLSAEQAGNAATVSAVTVERNMLPHAAIVGLATVAVETRFQNLSYGDRDSLGLFQQRPSQGWGTAEQVQDPIYAANAFYANLEAIENYQDLPVGEVAQRVQLSGYPDRYAQEVEQVTPWAQAFTGQAGSSVSCVLPAEVAESSISSFKEQLEAEFGSSIEITEEDGALRVRPTSTYTGAGSLEQEEANHAVLQAVANRAVVATSGFSPKSVEFDGKMWARDKNRDHLLIQPEGWVDSAASAESVLIRN